MTVTEEFRAARDRLLELRTDYAGAKQEFQWPESTEFNFGLDWFDQVAKDPLRANTNALVIVEKDGSSIRCTWSGLSARSNQVANWMRSIGMKRGEKMVVMLGNRVELWEIMLAGIKLGMVMIPTTTQLAHLDLQDQVDRGGARWALAVNGDTAKFDKVSGDYTVIHVDGHAPPGAIDYTEISDFPTEFLPQVPTKVDETLLLYFTSGTTSMAKLVEHTHTSYPVGHLSTMFWIGLEPGDVHLNVASPGWAKHAWSNFFTPWIAEATVLLYNYDRFDPQALMTQMDAESVTSFCAPPTVWRLLIQADLTALKHPPAKLVSAGEPLDAVVISQVSRAWGQTIRDGFGQTETTVQIANPPGLPIKIGAMGRPMPSYNVVLIDPATGEPGRIGEICLRLDPRPLGLMKSYFGDTEKTADAFRDGLYHTGDMAEIDEQGVITYVGRGDDVFKFSDYRLSPFELESVLIQHPAVAEAAVIPSPDALRLSVPKAFVVTAEGYEPSAEVAESILRHCRENLAPYKRIRRLEFIELPKTSSGKIRKVELRRHETARYEGAPELAPEGIEYRDDDFPSLKP